MAPPPTPAYPIPPSRAGRKALARAFAPEPSPDPRAPLWQTHLSTASSNNLWLMEGAEEPETPRVAFDGSRLRIEVLVWAADPGKRMIFVDGRKYVEGEALQPGTILERIAQDGVVLVHQGQRIRVPSQ
jgi:hypothetical protein